MIDVKNGILIWSDKHQGDLEAAKMIAFQEDVARTIAVQVAGDSAVIFRHLAVSNKNRAPATLTTYEAMLRFWEHKLVAIRSNSFGVSIKTELFGSAFSIFNAV